MGAQEAIRILIQSLFDNSGAAAASTAFKGVEGSASAMVASLRAASAAQGNAADAVKPLSSALAHVDQFSTQARIANQQLAAANNALGKSASDAAGGMSVLPRTIAGLSHEAAAAATGMLTVTAALSVAGSVVQSFAAAFKFKADLDATTASINAQLTGVRDISQVYAQASAFAQRFKLTQQETTQAIAASIGVMRASKAPVEDILGVLARMQVLSPEQSLQEAAIALKALASGDTTSLVTRFEVGRDVANQMKAEIQGGADAVAVMASFLESSGIGMDTLAAKTEGASGKMKELAQAQEQLKLAQADFAQGPGMTILEGQIRVTSGATRLLSGDVAAMGAGLQTTSAEFAASALGAAAYATALASGATAAEAQGAANQAATAATQALTQAHTNGGGGAFEFAGAAEATAIAAQQAAAAAAQDALEQNRLAVAHMLGAGAADAARQAAQQQTESLIAQIAQTQQSAIESQKLAEMQAVIANLGGAVAGGLMTAGDAAAQLAQMYHIATGAAMALINAQAALAQAKVNTAALVEQRSGERGPGTSGAAEAAAQEDARLKMIYAKLVTTTKTGGAARASAAGAGAATLESIEQKTGDKIAAIVAATQQKITAIAEREAAKQAAALRKLNESIATMTADRRASNEADDLDLIGVTDPKQAAQLNDREKAQSDARTREAAAQAEARAQAEAGDAVSAEKTLNIRETQINAQQSLDEHYYARQRELAGDPANEAALTKQYDEATRANAESAQARLAIAAAEASQKKAEVQGEKDAVIAAANEQANQVIGAADRSAAGVTKATGAARATAVANLRAIGDAVTAIPAAKTITITVSQAGTVGTASAGSGSSGNKAAGGGAFMTSGKTSITVGDNPGGRELVTVVPISGTGTSSASGNMVQLAGGGTVDAGGGYTTPTAGGDRTEGKSKSKGKGKGSKSDPAADAKKALDEMKNTISLLMDMAKLKEQIAALAGVPAFDIPLVQALVDRAKEFTAYVTTHLVPLTKGEGEALARYLSAAKDAASMISDMASLKKDIAELKDVPAFDRAMVFALIDRAQEFTTAVQQHLIPLTEFERDQMGRYATVVGDVVTILKDVADLKKTLAEVSPPIDDRVVAQLAADAARITAIVTARLVPTTQAQADAMSLYRSIAQDTISVLKDVIDLGKSLKESGAPAIGDELIIRLADQAARIATLVSARLVPATKEQADGVASYASLVGSSVSALKSVLDLSGKLFTDYTSPSDAQIGMLATDAKRVADGVMQAAAGYSTEGLAAGKAYAEGVGATFTAFKDGLLFFDALKSGDFKLDTGALAAFEQSTLMTLDVAKRLGAVAATIPAGDITALQTTTAALAAQSEALIKLAAVPFGDIPGAAAGLQQQSAQLLGGSGGGNTIYNTFNLPAGSNQQTVAMVIQQLNAQMGMRR